MRKRRAGIVNKLEVFQWQYMRKSTRKLINVVLIPARFDLLKTTENQEASGGTAGKEQKECFFGYVLGS